MSNFGIVNVMMSFRSDWRKAFVISMGYGMGDPLAPSESEENRGDMTLQHKGFVYSSTCKPVVFCEGG